MVLISDVGVLYWSVLFVEEHYLLNKDGHILGWANCLWVFMAYLQCERSPSMLETLFSYISIPRPRNGFESVVLIAAGNASRCINYSKSDGSRRKIMVKWYRWRIMGIGMSEFSGLPKMH